MTDFNSSLFNSVNVKQDQKVIIKKKLTRQYYEDKAQEVMEEYLRENKNCFAIRDIQEKNNFYKKLQLSSY